jgi:hypothetical protein
LANITLAAGSSCTLTTTFAPLSGQSLYDNGVAIGTANIGSNGVVSSPVTNVSKGQHTYPAKYAGTTNYAAATSASSTITAY